MFKTGQHIAHIIAVVLIFFPQIEETRRNFKRKSVYIIIMELLMLGMIENVRLSKICAKKWRNILIITR